MNTETILTRLKNAQKIYKKYDIKHIYLVGSCAVSEQTTESDIDLYIPEKIMGDIYDYMNCKYDFEELLGKKVDLITDNNLRDGIKEYLLKDMIKIQ